MKWILLFSVLFMASFWILWIGKSEPLPFLELHDVLNQVAYQDEVKERVAAFGILLDRKDSPTVMERRRRFVDAWNATGMHVEIVRGTDGHASLPPDLMRSFTRGKRLDAYFATNQAARRSFQGNIGAVLSHVRMLHRIIADEIDMALVLESDAIPINATSFRESLNTSLRNVPSNFDLLYLNACYHQVGAMVAPNIRRLEAGACIWGVVVRRVAAIKLLSMLYDGVGSDMALDLAYDQAMRNGWIKAYITDPPLIGVMGGGSVMDG